MKFLIFCAPLQYHTWFLSITHPTSPAENETTLSCTRVYTHTRNYLYPLFLFLFRLHPVLAGTLRPLRIRGIRLAGGNDTTVEDGFHRQPPPKDTGGVASRRALLHGGTARPRPAPSLGTAAYIVVELSTTRPGRGTTWRSVCVSSGIGEIWRGGRG